MRRLDAQAIVVPAVTFAARVRSARLEVRERMASAHGMPLSARRARSSAA